MSRPNKTTMSQFIKPTMNLWQGRIDDEEARPALRWHQCIQAWPGEALADSSSRPTTLLGFACDEGVKRNKGRPGAIDGPDTIRKALANLCHNGDQPTFDMGTVRCQDDQLEAAQKLLGEKVEEILQASAHPVVLGGGHEVAWGSYQGVDRFLQSCETTKPSKLGIINFDAHFDLRSPRSITSSGTPFRQIAESRRFAGAPFPYLVLGLNPASNTSALFDYARDRQVQWLNDLDCHWAKLDQNLELFDRFVADLDYLHLSICMDVFAAAFAPGVSAPAALGIEPLYFFELLSGLIASCNKHKTHIVLMEIAETSPALDRDNITSALAARIVHHYALSSLPAQHESLN